MNDVTHVPRRPGTPGPPAELLQVLDVTLGAVGATLGAGLAVLRFGSRVAKPVAGLVWHPGLLPTRYQPATLLNEAAQVGAAERQLAVRRLAELLDAWMPLIVEALVDRLDLTALVKEHVDLDEIVGSVDLDAAVARVDLDAAVARVDLDGVVAKVDLDGAVARVDLDGVVAKVDLDAAVARVDMDAIIDRIDLVGLAEEIIDAIDLPAIIRESTGSMASETVRGVRMSGISADEAISRAVDRALFRRRRPDAPAGGPG